MREASPPGLLSPRRSPEPAALQQEARGVVPALADELDAAMLPRG